MGEGRGEGESAYNMQMDELTQAVFDAVYHSPRQRLLRLAFVFLLGLKHTLRGLLFSWPLYLLSLAGLALPGQFAWAFLLLLIPAVWVSGYLLRKGLREDYEAQVRGRLLEYRDLRRALYPRG